MHKYITIQGEERSIKVKNFSRIILCAYKILLFLHIKQKIQNSNNYYS